jgi:hypothetical protein
MNKSVSFDDEVRGVLECKMYITPDRRVKPRIDCDYPAIVEGYDGDGTKYNEQAKLANLSASGLYMLANRYIENGSKLSVTVHLSNSLKDKDAPRLATNGTVVRTELQSNGMCGIAIKFFHYRFL